MEVKPCSSSVDVNLNIIGIALYGFIKIRDSGCVLSEFSFDQSAIVVSYDFIGGALYSEVIVFYGLGVLIEEEFRSTSAHVSFYVIRFV